VLPSPKKRTWSGRVPYTRSAAATAVGGLSLSCT
jgi:hypothetical protein